MKKILTIALLLIAINAQGQGLPVAANATLASLFPDENLRRVVAEVLGPNAGLTGQRLSDELAGIEALSTSGYERTREERISNADGIGYLIGLTELDLRSHRLTRIDVSNLTNLVYLTLSGNNLTILNVSNLTNLIFLNVAGNALTTLDVSNLANLSTRLDVSWNALTTLDVSNLINLSDLDVDGNPLTTLDISKLVNLISINVSRTQLATLDIRNNTQLVYLILEYGALTTNDIVGYHENLLGG